ncbi:RNA 2',3'-cyclic phosphodiesterase [Streptomyces sp. DSM 44915]|uniref:RNA 2',3'-cyclic phosphodiesterase n=1 Tax=Streptomyces chisholmiae TaxID=3075540 RepID=A0ABU2JTW2_9ACTN|nr:RNA 2',3'-cyclic phosphodiesterase [Streptomyces sp. DSM 44915]MDT0268179.1 RNA 2',3'-cyclic phosphodiesterase [Streptomyces sp. DSM 44915]
MRFFAALLPPAEALDELGLAAVPLRALPGDERLRWVARPDWHITLAFFGAVEPDQLPALRAGLAEVAGNTPPLTLRLAGAGAFGRRHLWAGVAGDLAPLGRLAAASAAAGQAAGAPGGTPHDAYRPHLTLARHRDRNGDLDSRLALLSGFRGSPWPAGPVVLMSADDDPGAGYTTEAGWPLGGAAAGHH